MNMFRAFMELDEVYSPTDRQTLINNIKGMGRNYNFSKYSTEQLYRMWQRLCLVTDKKPAKVAEPVHELALDFEDDYSPYCDLCGTRLSDAGFCPVCYDGEEDLAEGIFDSNPITGHSWVSASGQPIKLPSSMPSTGTNVSGQNQIVSTPSSTSKYIVRIVLDKGRLRAFATDGVHPGGWVAFPNDLRQFEGQTYEVDQLIWNGKNYRVSGNIVEV